MKYFALLVCLGLLFGGCDKNSSSGSFADIQSGSVSGETYTNESLGMTMQVPPGWVVKPDPNEDTAPGASDQAQRLKRKKRLFFICKEKFNCNNSLLAVVQDTSYARGANTTDKYYQYLVDQHEAQHGDLKITGHYARGTAQLGGKEFTTLSVKRQDSHKRFLALEKLIYFRINGSNLIQINLHAENDKDRATLKKTLETINFEE